MSLHHFPYRLTLHQRRLLAILVAAAREAEARGETVPPLATAELAARLTPPAQTRVVKTRLEAMQYKLPLIPHRPWRIRCEDRPAPTGGRQLVWWVERKRSGKVGK